MLSSLKLKYLRNHLTSSDQQSHQHSDRSRTPTLTVHRRLRAVFLLANIYKRVRRQPCRMPLTRERSVIKSGGVPLARNAASASASACAFLFSFCFYSWSRVCSRFVLNFCSALPVLFLLPPSARGFCSVLRVLFFLSVISRSACSLTSGNFHVFKHWLSNKNKPKPFRCEPS